MTISRHTSLVRLYRSLAFLDLWHAIRVREARCPHCQGPLHAAHYWRQPWGLLPSEDGRQELSAFLRMRWSWCCGRRGCRRRVTPESWRFCGRRFYVGLVVVLLSGLDTGAEVAEAEAVVAQVDGPTRKTRLRWLEWWRTRFTQSLRWVELLGRLPCGLPVSRLPGCLVAMTSSRDWCALLVAGLWVIRPFTGGTPM